MAHSTDIKFLLHGLTPLLSYIFIIFVYVKKLRSLAFHVI